MNVHGVLNFVQTKRIIAGNSEKSSKRFHVSPLVCRLLVLLLWLLSPLIPPSVGQATKSTSPTKPHTSQRTAPQDQDELTSRIETAQNARASGDLLLAGRANKQVVALALKRLGHFRLLEGAYLQAIEILNRSLDFEESPETRLDLAMSEMAIGSRPDNAISDAGRVLKTDPRNYLALTISGRAWMQKHDYAKASEFLERAIAISPELETQYSLGISLLSTDDPEGKKRAASVFHEIVRTSGDSGSLHVLFGRAYRDAKDMPAAIKEFERAVALDTRTPHAHYFLALARLSVNEWKPTPEIRAEFFKELQFYPRDYLANYMVGFLASIDRDYASSSRYLKMAAEISPDVPEPWLYLGLNAYAQEDSKNAEEYFRKAVTLTGEDESRSNYQIRRAYVSLGRILAATGREEESEKFLGKARELQKKSMELTQQEISAVITEGGGTMGAVVPLRPDREQESAALLNSGKDIFARVDAATMARTRLTDKQRSALEAEEVRLRAILGLSFNDLATAEAMGGQFLAALGHYQDAERWDPTIPGLSRNIGLSAFRAGNLPEAIRGLSKALAANSDDVSVRAVLGSVYFSSEDFANAAKTIAPLGDRAAHDPVLGYAWAASLMRLGDFPQASKILQEVEKLLLPPDALLLVGKLWVELENYERAVIVFQRVMAADPKQPRVHYSAGLAYLRWQHLPEAIGEFNLQLQLTPGDADTLNGLGLVYLEQGKRVDAAGLFKSVVENHPENGNAQYQFGKLLLDDGNAKDAITHLELAAKAMPQSDYVHYQLQAAYRKDARIEEADRELELYKELKARNRQASIPRPSPNSQ